MKKTKNISGRKLFFLIIILFLSIYPAPASANLKASASSFVALSPADLISSINNYRLQNGLNALQTNSLLSHLAQVHVDYQASIEMYTHTGPGGTSPKDRAISAGYNDGDVTYYSEIIYAGYNAVTSDAINWWKNSYDHNRMMLSPYFNEAGAGIASDGSWNYYTVEFGYSSGVETSSNNSVPDSNSTGSDTPSIPVILYAVPVVKATPREDGAVIHVLQAGQVPWTLAFIYEIDLDLLLLQNGLTINSFVYTGDEIIIVPSNTPTVVPPTPTATVTESFTATIEPSATQPASETPTIEVTITKTEIPQITETLDVDENSENLEERMIQWIVMVSFLIFLVLIVSSMFSSKK